MVTLILGGIISGALFTALLSIIKYTADPYNQLPRHRLLVDGKFAGCRAEANFDRCRADPGRHRGIDVVRPCARRPVDGR